MHTGIRGQRGIFLCFIVALATTVLPVRSSAQMLGLFDYSLTSGTWAHPSGDGGGGIASGVLKHTVSGTVVPTTGYLVCDGDERNIWLNTTHPTYSWVRILDVTDAQANNITSGAPYSGIWPNYTPGNYTGYTVPYRNADVRARTAWLVDQMTSAATGADANKDWGLQWAVWTTWSGYTLPSGLQPATVTWYNTWLTQAAGINAGNYTNSNAIWLVANGIDNTRYQNLFMVMVPEPAFVQLPALLIMGGFGTGLWRRRVMKDRC